MEQTQTKPPDIKDGVSELSQTTRLEVPAVKAIPQNQPEDEDRDDEKRQFIWDWAKHEDAIALNRGNFFLVGESMMVAAYATLIASSVPQAQSKLNLVCALGLAISLVWLFVNVLHIEKTEKPIKKKLRDEVKIDDWVSVEAKRFKRIRIHYIIGYVLPLVFCLVWTLFMFL